MDWRNLGQRVIIGVIFMPLILSAMWAGKLLFPLFCGVAVALVLVELFSRPEAGGSPLLNVSVTLFGIVYVAGLLSFSCSFASCHA